MSPVSPTREQSALAAVHAIIHGHGNDPEAAIVAIMEIAQHVGNMGRSDGDAANDYLRRAAMELADSIAGQYEADAPEPAIVADTYDLARSILAATSDTR